MQRREPALHRRTDECVQLIDPARPESAGGSIHRPAGPTGLSPHELAAGEWERLQIVHYEFGGTGSTNIRPELREIVQMTV